MLLRLNLHRYMRVQQFHDLAENRMVIEFQKNKFVLITFHLKLRSQLKKRIQVINTQLFDVQLYLCKFAQLQSERLRMFVT